LEQAGGVGTSSSRQCGQVCDTSANGPRQYHHHQSQEHLQQQQEQQGQLVAGCLSHQLWQQQQQVLQQCRSQ
jgi:hypothetical protein